MRPWIAVTMAVSAAATGAVLGWVSHQPRHDVSEYARTRLAAIRQHLDEAEPGFVLIAGDSQAELQSPSARLCGAPLVNAGISGATASVYADLSAGVNPPVRPRATVLTIGTNDLLRKNDPLAPASVDRFEADLGRIVARLGSFGGRVLVTALPPLGRETADEMEPEAVGLYSARIVELCRRLGCTATDPFSDLRDGTSGFGRPGVNRDGLHLARYRPALQSLAATLCPDDAAAR